MLDSAPLLYDACPLIQFYAEIFSFNAAIIWVIKNKNQRSNNSCTATCKLQIITKLQIIFITLNFALIFIRIIIIVFILNYLQHLLKK